MAKNGARKNTTLEERINIVEECINTGCNYASTANKYGCSYGQVYAWVRKYKDKGIEGLYDRRGKNKAIYNVLPEPLELCIGQRITIPVRHYIF